MSDYMNFNQVGNLTKDPVEQIASTGKRYLTGALAYGPKSGNTRNFVPVTIWLQDAKGAEFDAPILHKGDFVRLVGNIRQERWIREDGTQVTSFKVHCTPKGVMMIKAKATSEQQELLPSEEV